MSVRIVTININFNLGPARVDEEVDEAADNADVLLVQEAKNANLKRLIPKGWEVYQDMSSEARQGVAICWRPSVVKIERKGMTMGVRADGVRMLDRWIMWADAVIEGEKVTLGCSHAPPGRFRAEKYDGWANSVEKFIKGARYPVVFGADWNWQLDQNPARLATRTGHRFMGYGIDGFLVSRKLNLSGLWRAAKVNSDHRAVGVKLSADRANKPADTYKLSVVTSNLERGHRPAQVRADLDYVAQQMKPDIWGAQETKDYLALLRDTDGYGVAMPQRARGDAIDNLILYRKSTMRLVGADAIMVSNTVKSLADRYINWAHFKSRIDGSSIYLFNTHLYPRIEAGGNPRDLPRTKAAYAHLAKLAKMAQSRAAGANLVFWTGDFNIDEDADDRERHPRFMQQVFTEHGLVSVYDELNTPASFGTLGKRKVDIIGSHKDDARVKALGVRRSDNRHSDHFFVEGIYQIIRLGGSPKDPTSPEPGVGNPTNPNQDADPPPFVPLPSEKDQGSQIDHSECCGGTYA